MTASPSRLATASAVGTTLEWYDFTVYNTLAALIFNRLFFPSFDPLTGTILAFSTYAVGYVSRPVGGMLFGHMGDRRGRRVVLCTTLIVMGVATGLMGLLPTYASVGAISPLLLVVLRFVQGVALGGEWAGAVLISVEHGGQQSRGRKASWAQIGPSCGNILATGAIALLTVWLTADEFLAWGWRIPFLGSGALVAFGVWVRQGIDETPLFKDLEARQRQATAPIGEVVRLHWRRLLIAGGARIGPDVLYGLVVVFSLTYITTVLQLSRTLALTAIMTGSAVNALAIPLFGALSDRVGRRPVYAAAAVLAMPWAFGFFALLDRREPALVIMAVALGLLLHAGMYATQAAFMTEQFPTRVRYAGSSLAYTLAGIVGGGFAPLIFTRLLQAYRSSTSISIYLVVALCVTCVCLFVARETGMSPLEE